MQRDSAQLDNTLRQRGPWPVGRRRGRALGMLLVGLLSLLAPRPTTQAQEAWEYSPYRIQVWVAFAPSAELPPRIQEEIIRTLLQRSDIVAAATWRLSVEPAPIRLSHDINQAPEKITFSQLTGLPEEDPDNPESSATAARKRAAEKAAAEESGESPGALTDDEQVLSNDKVYLLGVSYELGRYRMRSCKPPCFRKPCSTPWSRPLRRWFALKTPKKKSHSHASAREAWWCGPIQL